MKKKHTKRILILLPFFLLAILVGVYFIEPLAIYYHTAVEYESPLKLHAYFYLHGYRLKDVKLEAKVLDDSSLLEKELRENGAKLQILSSSVTYFVKKTAFVSDKDTAITVAVGSGKQFDYSLIFYLDSGWEEVANYIKDDTATLVLNEETKDIQRFFETKQNVSIVQFENSMRYNARKSEYVIVPYTDDLADIMYTTPGLKFIVDSSLRPLIKSELFDSSVEDDILKSIEGIEFKHTANIELPLQRSLIKKRNYLLDFLLSY